MVNYHGRPAGTIQALSRQPLTIIVIVSLLFFTFTVTIARRQNNPQTAEAIQHANLRAWPGVDYAQVAAIDAGTHYSITGRHGRLPRSWLSPPASPQRGAILDLS